MHILAICQYYKPEPFNVSDICEELVRRGHDVTVVTGRPNYPDGDLYKGYEGSKHLNETIEGVDVYRTRIIPRKKRTANRILNYFSFPLLGKRCVRCLKKNYDVVLVFQFSPVMMAKPGLFYAKRKHVPLLLYVIDIWPESLLAGGVRKDSLLYRWFSNVSKKIYSSADVLAVTSPSFDGYIANLIGKKVEALYLPQYAEDIFINTPVGLPEGYSKKKINLTFAGNVGSAQSVETIVRAAALLEGHDEIVFHIVGSGSELDKCRALAQKLNLSNVIFHGRKPLEDMPLYHSVSDAMVATFSSMPTLALTLPRKIQSYMAAGRPIIGAVTGEAKYVIEEAKCGFCCKTEDYEGLAEICIAFSELTTEEKRQLGRSAKDYYENHFSRQIFFETLENQLNNMEGTARHD